jgi:nitrite reductase/ring-hydroxylating ferredoxin subunit
LIDPSTSLEAYPVEVRDGEVILRIPVMTWDREPVSLGDAPASPGDAPALSDNEFFLKDIPSGTTGLVRLDGKRVAIYNTGGEFYATGDACTHAGGPLSEGELEGICITCPWHGSIFDVRDGSVVRGPADRGVKSYRVETAGEIGRVLEV